MALLGSSVDPRLFLQDYSGFTRAAEIQAQGLQNLGQNIASGIEAYGNMKKEQAEQSRQVKQAENIGKLIVQTMPEYADFINLTLATLGDQNIPLADRVTAALNITEGFKTRLDLEGLKREREIDALRQQKLRMSMQPPAAPAAPVAEPSFFDL